MARSLVVTCLALLCAAAAYRQFNVAQAERFAQARTPEGLMQATRYAPDDASKWRQLGVALIRTQSDGAMAALQTAVQLAPSDAEALVALAYESERLGRLSDAERLYIRAAEYSRRLRPKYALAGFDLRNKNLDRFWPIAAEAVHTPAADVTGVLRLAHATEVKPEQIPELLQLHTDRAEEAYVAFALAENIAEPAAAVALRLPSEQRYSPLLLNLCDRLIQTGRTDSALAVWNRLPDVDKLDPAAGRSLGAATFGEPQSQGFHWRYTGLRGTLARLGGESDLRVEFTGEQPERGPVLAKIAPVLPSRRYRLQVSYSTANIDGPNGLSWTIAALNGSGGPIAVAPLTGSEGTAVAEFTTPAGCTMLRISLVYARAIGTVRIAGVVQLRTAKLELL